MTLKHVLCLVVSLLLTAGIALAQQTSPSTQPQMPGEPFGAFSLLFEGGSFLGIYAEDINKNNVGQYGLRDARGVGVTEVVKDSPAEKAGVRKGDVILRFENEAVTSVRKLNRLVSEVAPDHTVTLSISRGGAEQQLSATIGSRKNYSASSMPGLENMPELRSLEGLPGLKDGPNVWKMEIPEGKDSFIYAFGNNRRIGVSTTALTKQLAEFFGVPDGKGVLVTSVETDGPAAKAGLKAGDVITAIDGEKIEGSGDLARGINRQKDGEVTLTVVRDKASRTFKLTPEKAARPNLQGIRGQIRNEILRGVGENRIVIPRIVLPTIPAIDVSVPQIDLPVIPEINVVIPKTPKVKVIRGPRGPI